MVIGQLFNFNSLPNNRVLGLSKFKTFADNKINVAQMMISVFHRVENILGKGENAGYQHFLLFPQCFQKASFLGSLKVRIMWQRVYMKFHKFAQDKKKMKFNFILHKTGKLIYLIPHNPKF